jgi:hypothetical protein
MPKEQTDYEYNILLGRHQRGGPQANDHELNRRSVLGMYLNTGPNMYYEDPVTKQIVGQPFKFVNPFANPGAYIVRGMYPDGDGLSMVTTITAGIAGLFDGAFSEDFRGRELIDKVNAQHPAPLYQK